MSFTNIEYVDSLQRWELSVKLFKDDFGDELSRCYGYEFVEDDSDSTKAEPVFRKFLNKYLELRFDGQRIATSSWVYSGKKINFEAVWLSFYFEVDEMPVNIRVKNELMFGLYNDQKNLLIFTHEGKQKAFQFRRNKSDIEFEVK